MAFKKLVKLMLQIGQRPGPVEVSAGRRMACALFVAAGAVIVALASTACSSHGLPPSAHIATSSSAVGGDIVAPPSVAPAPASSANPDGIETPANPSASSSPVLTVAGLSPASGAEAGGDRVTITGSGFTYVKQVTFGTASASDIVVNSDTEITAISPPGTGTVDVTVVTATGISPSPASQFTYVAGPSS